MNLILLDQKQFVSDNQAVLSSRQTVHIDNILGLTENDYVNVGKINGSIGKAKLVNKVNTGNQKKNELNWRIEIDSLNNRPPNTLGVTLILAMPRPQMLKRILQTVACLGVESLHLIQTSRVEKSFWQSPSATTHAMHEQLILGLEQGMATQLPKIYCHKRFTPFMQDILPGILNKGEHIVAHPNSKQNISCFAGNKPATLAIGPEGGFIDQEVSQFEKNGFISCSMGQRILKVEIAVTALISKLFI